MKPKKYESKEMTLGEKAYELQIGSGKIFPHDIEMEMALLCGLLTYSSSIINVATILKPTDFYLEKHNAIYTAILTTFEQGDKVDILNTTKQLRKTGELEFCGGSGYISKILMANDSRDVLKDALFIIELAKKRELIVLGTEVVSKAYSELFDVFDLVSEMQNGIVEILTFKMSKDTDFSKIAMKTWKEIEDKKENALAGMPSKFRNTNILRGGYRKGTLVTVAGRPGMGKSLHLVNEAIEMSKNGYNVAIFSLEMASNEVVKRMMSIGTQIEGWKLDKNSLSHDEILSLQKYVINSPHILIDIDDTAGVDVIHLITQMKRIKFKNEQKNNKKSGLDIVFIDYLQLMRLGKSENRNIGIGDVTRRLKTLSKELDCCIVVYSQLSRATETRGGDKRPQLSDLKESGSIEEDSDIVEFIYRPEYYGIAENENGESTTGLLEIITAKNRQGGTGTTNVKFMPTISTLKEFVDYIEVPKKIDRPITLGVQPSIDTFESELPRTLDQGEINF